MGNQAQLTPEMVFFLPQTFRTHRMGRDTLIGKTSLFP